MLKSFKDARQEQHRCLRLLECQATRSSGGWGRICMLGAPKWQFRTQGESNLAIGVLFETVDRHVFFMSEKQALPWADVMDSINCISAMII